MRQIRNFSLLILLLLLYACIRSYDPVIKSSAEQKYVVSGEYDTEGWQMVEVTLSSPVQSPAFIPVRIAR